MCLLWGAPAQKAGTLAQPAVLHACTIPCMAHMTVADMIMQSIMQSPIMPLEAAPVLSFPFQWPQGEQSDLEVLIHAVLTTAVQQKQLYPNSFPTVAVTASYTL